MRSKGESVFCSREQRLSLCLFHLKRDENEDSIEGIEVKKGERGEREKEREREKKVRKGRLREERERLREREREREERNREALGDEQ
jgi:hypothetical protein